jgi:large subunit ribosomal protein L1
MGKVRTRFIGLEDLEEQQKKQQKQRSAEKKGKEAAAESADEATEYADSEAQAAQSTKAKAQPTTSLRGKTRGKKWKEAAKKVKADQEYSVTEAIKTLKSVAFAKFDESVELHLNVEKKGIKGEVELPHGTGKTVRVAIVSDEVLDQIENGNIEFDVLIAHPSFMPKLAKHARLLGPKGLMPNPKAGTVSPQPEEVAKKFEKGTLQWKSESKFPLVHQMVGKLSADDKALEENIMTFLNAVGPKQIDEAYLKSSMSPSIKLSLVELE